MATVTISILSALKAKLQRGACRKGISPDEYIVEALERGMRVEPVADIPHLSSDESVLLQEINKGLTAKTWEEYHALIAGRDDEVLTPSQHTRLIEISNWIELQNSRRIGALARLAEIRHASFDSCGRVVGMLPFAACKPGDSHFTAVCVQRLRAVNQQVVDLASRY